MRIAINTRFLIQGKLEGLGWHNYELCRALVEQHPADEFLFLFDRPFDKSFLFGPNVKGLMVPPPARRPVLWYTWFEWSLPLIFSWWKPDVFLSPDNYCSLRSKVPTVLVTHDIAHVHYPKQIPDWGLRYYDKYVPRFLQRADHILTVSSFVKNDILTHFPTVDTHKISVAPNALRGTFQPLDDQEQEQVRQQYAAGKPYFFYVGAIHPRKNLDRLIRAFDLFKKKHKGPEQLLIGGRFAWQTGSIKEAYEQAQFKEDICFLGYLSEEELPSLLASSMALTYVSLYEGFGLPILEAMHCEVPVITSDRASMTEVAGKAAILVNPEKEESIAKAMYRIQSEEGLSEKLIAAGRIHRQQFSWEKTAKIVYQKLQEVAQETP